MKIIRPIGHACAAASLTLASASAALGAPPAPPAPPAAPPVVTPASGKIGSVYVRCDGNPDNITTGETVARLVAITALVGLLMPQHEQADMSKRLTGAAGVDACTAALEKESNATRRVQLILARSVHHLEAGENEAALADARLAETDQPDFASAYTFKLSFHLSALELQGLALAAMGRTDEAAAKGLEMGAAAPYDFFNLAHALPLVSLTGRYGAEEKGFYDALVRAYPQGLTQRAYARERAGDFRGAAEDFETWIGFIGTISDKPPLAGFGQAAVARALAGDDAQAQAHIKAAEDGMQALAAEGKTSDAAAAELLDFCHMLALVKEGRADQARILFSARSAWTSVSGSAVAALAAMLRTGAKPEELGGPLAREPESFRQAELVRFARELTNEEGAKQRYAAIRPAVSNGQFNAYAANVWRDGGSKYIAKNETPKLNARIVNVLRDGSGLPAFYAIALHSALQARAQGKKQFMLIPIPRVGYAELVRFGNPGDPAFPAPLGYDAERVIADLSGIIPKPQPH